MYTAEILSAKGISVVAFANLVFTVLFGCCANLIFGLLSASTVYMMLFCIQIGCLMFLYNFMRETKGLSRDECQTLYQDPKYEKIKLEAVEMIEI